MYFVMLYMFQILFLIHFYLFVYSIKEEFKGTVDGKQVRVVQQGICEKGRPQGEKHTLKYSIPGCFSYVSERESVDQHEILGDGKLEGSLSPLTAQGRHSAGPYWWRRKETTPW